MSEMLQGRQIAILAADGVEQSALVATRDTLSEAGATINVIALRAAPIQTMSGHREASTIAIDNTIDEVDPEQFDALVLPGGLADSDELLKSPAAISFARAFFDRRKPVAAICRGHRLLVEAGVLRGRVVTSPPSSKTDIRRAGGTWIDREVVVDDRLVTSRKTDDLPAFGNCSLDIVRPIC